MRSTSRPARRRRGTPRHGGGEDRAGAPGHAKRGASTAHHQEEAHPRDLFLPRCRRRSR